VVCGVVINVSQPLVHIRMEARLAAREGMSCVRNYWKCFTRQTAVEAEIYVSGGWEGMVSFRC